MHTLADQKPQPKAPSTETASKLADVILLLQEPNPGPHAGLISYTIQDALRGIRVGHVARSLDASISLLRKLFGDIGFTLTSATGAYYVAHVHGYKGTAPGPAAALTAATLHAYISTPRNDDD